MAKQRVMMLDNLRAILIVLVVLGHTLERVSFPGVRALYFFLYSFHMPAMAFLSGLCFRRGRTGIWRSTAAPYLLFQVLYLAETAWETGEPMVLQFSRPSWILWYLLALVLWQMAANLTDLTGPRGLAAAALSLVCGIGVGFDKQVGYFFSLSRAVAFFPFFLAGAWIRENRFDRFLGFFQGPRPLWKTGALLLPALVTQVLLYRQKDLCKSSFFYCAVGYDEAYTPQVRMMIFLAAAAAILALLVLTPKKQLPLLSRLGQNTLPVYLIHGVVLKAVTHLGLLKALPYHGLLRAVTVTAALVAASSLPPCTFLFRKLFSGKKS